MNKKFKCVATIIAFLVTIVLITSGYMSYKQKHEVFEAKNISIASSVETTLSRLKNAVITLPDDQAQLQLKDGVGSYVPKAGPNGTASLDSLHMVTSFVPGIWGKRQAHLDAIIPMFLSVDSHGSSVYVVLFNDRGDTAIEQSYARLGDKAVHINNIKILPADPKFANQEYRVDISYNINILNPLLGTSKITPKEAIIPVVDGHFDPKGTVTIK